MNVRNGLVFNADCDFVKADLAFENGIITDIAPSGSLSGDGFDAEGAYVLPGFIDMHSHGCVNSDFCDADSTGLEKMLAYYGRQGVTSVVLAAMSYGEDVLTGIFRAAVPYFGINGYGAVLRGINMEGPFINPDKCGAQNPGSVIAPDTGMFDRLYAVSGKNIRLLGIAPELPGGLELIRHAAGRCAVGLAHTAADYDTAAAAFNSGASHVIHMFNAMPPFGHRAPGVIGAAFDYAAYVEIICDGVHLHHSVVRAMFRMFGASRICLVSDSIRGAGMPDGRYELNGQTVIVKEGRSNLANGGAIAGSVVNLPDCVRNAVKIGIGLNDAVRAASLNPARAASIDSTVGSLEPGKSADILIWDADLRTVAVFAAGERI